VKGNHCAALAGVQVLSIGNREDAVICFGSHGECDNAASTCEDVQDWAGLGNLSATDRIRQLLVFAYRLAVDFGGFGESIRLIKHANLCEACVVREPWGTPVIMTTPAFMRMILSRFGEWAVVGIFLHELAHVAIGHLDHRTPRNSFESLVAEASADAWALKTLLLGGGKVRPLVEFLARSGSGGDTHPPGPMRAELAAGFIRREMARLATQRAFAI